jgi:hypothetical protein
MKLALLLMLWASNWLITPDSDVERHISVTVGERYRQRCTNGGTGDEPDHDGFRRCFDTFTNKRTGESCHVNPENQNQFVCKAKRE